MGTPGGISTGDLRPCPHTTRAGGSGSTVTSHRVRCASREGNKVRRAPVRYLGVLHTLELAALRIISDAVQFDCDVDQAPGGLRGELAGQWLSPALRCARPATPEYPRGNSRLGQPGAAAPLNGLLNGARRGYRWQPDRWQEKDEDLAKAHADTPRAKASSAVGARYRSNGP